MSEDIPPVPGLRVFELLPNRLDAGGLEAAVACDERQAEMQSSCGDDTVGHIRNHVSRDILKSVCDGSIYQGDGQSYARIV